MRVNYGLHFWVFFVKCSLHHTDIIWVLGNVMRVGNNAIIVEVLSQGLTLYNTRFWWRWGESDPRSNFL